METSYCLKEDYDLIAVNEIEKELHADGVQLCETIGTACSADGSYRSNTVITTDAFYTLCSILYNSRRRWRQEKHMIEAETASLRRRVGFLSILCALLAIVCVLLAIF